MDRADIVTNLLNRQQRLEEVRSGHEDSMQTAFNYVNPRRYDMSGTATKGAKRQTKMYDGVAQDAFWDWVAGMIGWGVSESTLWQRAAIVVRDLRESDPVQRYLDDFTEQMDWEYRQSNYYDEALPEQIQDAGSGGTGVLITEESRDLSRSIHRTPHPGRYWVAQNADYDYDIYHEEVPLTARQAFQKYSKSGDTLPALVKKWAADPTQASWEVLMLECICPSDDPAIFPRRIVPGPYALVTILKDMTAGGGSVTSEMLTMADAERLIRVEPLSYFPPSVWPCRKNSDEVYGYSPAMDVLTMIEAAQQHGYNLLNMGNHAANPSKFIPKEAFGQWSFLPGAKNHYMDEKRIAYTMQMAQEYPVAVDRENKIHDLIRKRYGWHVWNAMLNLQLKKERVQAAEVLEVRSDQARLLVAQFNNFWRRAVRPTYDAKAFIAGRAGRLPEPPAELQDRAGQDIIVPTFIGPFSQLQIMATKLGGVQQGLSMLGNLTEIVGRHIGPEEAAEIYARLNLPDLAEYICDHTGFPQRLMNSDEDTMTIIRARRQRTAALEQAVNAQKLAAAAASAGKAVPAGAMAGAA